MATATTYATGLEAVGWAKETTQGTAVLPLVWTNPVDSFNPVDNVTWIKDAAMRSSMVATYGVIQGPISIGWDMAGPCFMDGLPYLLSNILGDETATGTGPTTHAYSVLNSGTAQPGSLTIVHYQGMPATTHARSYSGCVLSDLTITGNAESSLIGYQAKGLGWQSLDVPTTPPTYAPTVIQPQAAWRYGLGMGGTVVGAPNKTVRDFSLTISRELKVENTLQNVQTPYIIQRGKVTVTGSFTVTVPSDETFLNYLLNNTQPQIQIAGSIGATTTLYGLQLDMLLGAMQTANIKTDELALGYNVTFEAVANTTNAGASGGFSPIKVTVTNQTAGAY